MGILMNIFGQKGTIKFDRTTYDGKTYNCKSRIEMFAASEEDIIQHLRQMMYVEKDVLFKTIKILGFYEN